MRKQAGLTLVELMVTLAIAGLLLVGGLPSMMTMIDNSRGFDQANAYFTALSFARGQAVNLGTSVTVCNLASGTTGSCTANWQNGVTVFVDANNNGTVDVGADQVLRRVPPIASGDTHKISFTNSRATFGPEGMAEGAAGSFFICPSDNKEVARRIIVSNSGRTTVVTYQDDPGISCS